MVEFLFSPVLVSVGGLDRIREELHRLAEYLARMFGQE